MFEVEFIVWSFIASAAIVAIWAIYAIRAYNEIDK